MHPAVVFILFLTVHASSSLRILGLFPFQMHSHFIMCKELMLGLAAKGHQVDVYGHFPLEKPVLNYRDISLKGTLPAMMDNVTYDQLSVVSPPLDFINNLLRDSASSMCRLMVENEVFRKLRDNPPRDPPYDVIVMEYSQSNCYIAYGRHLKIPVIGIVTLPTHDWIYAPLGSPLKLAAEPSVFSPYFGPMTFAERLNNVLMYHLTSAAFHRVIREQNHYVHQFFGLDYPDNMEAMKDFSLILLNHDLAMNGVRSFAPSIVPVGGLHIVDHNDTLPKDVKEWLDESTHGCVYFSFGSLFRIETISPSILRAFYRAFENIAPVRVLMKAKDPMLLSAGLPSNVKFHPWLPQIQVFKHKNVKVFLTHGGLMGTQESVYYGIPLVAVPLFGDQPLNVATYVKKGIAVGLNMKDITEESLTNAIKNVLENPTYKTNVQKMSRKFKDRLMSPIDTAAFWIEYVVRHGKNALRSPVVDMFWWQASLLDVYGFLLTAFVTILYISIKLLTIFTSILLRRQKSKENKLD